MNTRSIAILAAALLVGSAAGAQTTGTRKPAPAAPPNMTSPAGRAQLSMSESGFVKHAAQGGMAEVSLATTAETKSANADVKALAEKIKSDHEKANQQLQTLAGSKNVTLPAAPSIAEKATAKRLDGLNGAAFDRAYVNEMVKDHRADIRDFQKHAKDKDPDVARFVTETLPVLQDHLKQAESVQKNLGGTKATSTKRHTKPSASTSPAPSSTK